MGGELIKTNRGHTATLDAVAPLTSKSVGALYNLNFFITKFDKLIKRELLILLHNSSQDFYMKLRSSSYKEVRKLSR